MTRDPFQYPIRRLVIRHCEVSKARCWQFKVSHYNLTGTLVAILLECLSNFSDRIVQNTNLEAGRLRNFSRWCLCIYNTKQFRGVMTHLVTTCFVLLYTACDPLHETTFVIHISDILLMQEISIGKDWRDRIRVKIGYCMLCDLEIKKIPIFALKGVNWVALGYISLFHCCFYVLILYLEPVPVWLSVWYVCH